MCTKKQSNNRLRSVPYVSRVLLFIWMRIWSLFTYPDIEKITQIFTIQKMKQTELQFSRIDILEIYFYQQILHFT